MKNLKAPTLAFITTLALIAILWVGGIKAEPIDYLQLYVLLWIAHKLEEIIA